MSCDDGARCWRQISVVDIFSNFLKHHDRLAWLKWVEAAKAQEILKKESPQHHCCTLYKEENVGSDANGENGSEKREATSKTEIVNQLQLDVSA
jgi:hypothetical protein